MLVATRPGRVSRASPKAIPGRPFKKEPGQPRKKKSGRERLPEKQPVRYSLKDCWQSSKRSNTMLQDPLLPSFLALPGEMRNLIYQYVLMADKRLEISDQAAPEEPALLRTCRSIRNEARPIFYSEDKFLLVSHNLNVAPALKFYKKHIGPGGTFAFNRKNVPEVEVEGPSRFDAEIDYIKTWYNREWNVSPEQKTCASKDGRDGWDFVSHRCWDIARDLRKEKVPWEVAKRILDSAGELLMAGGGLRARAQNWKPEASVTCCSASKDRPEGAKAS